MSKIIDWDICEKEFVKEAEPDLKRVDSIVKKAEFRLVIVRKIEEIRQNISFIVEGYYEIIKELLVAYLLKDGLRSKNHQCLISYFYKKNPEFEFESNLMSQMCFFRNRLDYYGEDIPEEFYFNNKENFEKVIKLVFGLLKREKEKR